MAGVDMITNQADKGKIWEVMKSWIISTDITMNQVLILLIINLTSFLASYDNFALIKWYTLNS